MSFIKLLILFASAVLVGLPFLSFTIKSERMQKLLLSFSGAFILALCLVHLLPEVYDVLSAEHAGLIIFTGFLLQQVLDYFSGGLEHGHLHQHSHSSSHSFPYAVFVALCVHAFAEGLPLSQGDASDALFKGILLHNIPISIALVQMLQNAKTSNLKTVLALCLFAAMTPAGSLLSGIFIINNPILPAAALALVIGIFFHIGTTILFEAEQNHRFNLIKFISILLGAALAFILH
jgi:zinc and cadmium transporter